MQRLCVLLAHTIAPVLTWLGRLGDAAQRLRIADLERDVRLLRQDVAKRDATLAIRAVEVAALTDVITRDRARVELEIAMASAQTALQGTVRRPN